MKYFTSYWITDKIARIVDVADTAAYLVVGKERACLIDTGDGIGSIRSVVESLTGLPYDVILTHGHVDHASGAGEFLDKRVYLHPADRELMRVHTVFANRTGYMEHAKGIHIPEGDLIPQMDPSKTLPLADGQRFDLGGLHLEAIHVPGHTHGMCMVLIEEERTILFGDGCGVSVMLLDEEATSVEEYHEALVRLTRYEDRYDHIIRNHGTYVSPKSLLANVIECCELVLARKDDHFPVPHGALPNDYHDAFFAKALDPTTHGRVDGKQGNLAYRPSKIWRSAS